MHSTVAIYSTPRLNGSDLNIAHEYNHEDLIRNAWPFFIKKKK